MKLAKNKVLVLRVCDAQLKSYNGFQWSRSGIVEAPDWNPEPKCGHGLHGLLWGEGEGGLLSQNADAVWLVVKVKRANVVDLNGKVKFPQGTVVHCGDRNTATQFIYRAKPTAAICYITLTGGNYSTLTGGYGSTLTGGNYSTLTGGNYSTLTGGYGSTLTGGNYSTLTGGDGSTLTGGDGSTLTGGDGSTLTGGDGGTLTGGDGSTLTGGDGSTLTGGDGSTLTGGVRSTLTGGYGSTLTGGVRSTLIYKIWDGDRFRLYVFYVGENGIRPNTPYRFSVESKQLEVAQ